MTSETEIERFKRLNALTKLTEGFEFWESYINEHGLYVRSDISALHHEAKVALQAFIAEAMRSTEPQKQGRRDV